MRIRAELEQRGIEQDLIRDSLNAGVDWTEAAVAMLAKRLQTPRALGESSPDASDVDAATRQRTIRYLSQRGFAYEHINRAFATLSVKDEG